MIAHSPLHRSGRAGFPHPAPASGDDAKAAQGIGVADAGGRQPAVDEAPHPVPADAAGLAAAREGAVPEPADLEPEQGQRRGVHGHAVVVEVPADDRPQPAALLGDGMVQAPPELGLDLAQLGLQSLADSLPQHRETPVAPLLGTDVREAEKVERLRLAVPAPPALFGRERSELDQPRFLGVQFQLELAEPGRKVAVELPGILLALEAEHDVIGKSHDDDLAVGVPFAPGLDPEVERVVQVDIRQERRGAAPLRRSFRHPGSASPLPARRRSAISG